MGEELHVQLGSDDHEFGERDPLRWALGQLRSRLADAGVEARVGGEVPVGCSALRIVVARRDHRWGRAALAGYDVGVPCGPEAFVLARPGGERGPIVVVGGHERGLAYGVLELADLLIDEDDPLERLASVAPTCQTPATPVRSVVRAFSCADDVSWLHDREFWTSYLTELAMNRVNRIQLAFGMGCAGDNPGVRDNYLRFAYPFLIDAPGYDIRAEGVSATERDRNLAALRFASDEAARRGIQFQLGIWSHAVEHESNQRYPIHGLTAANHASYAGVALGQLLRSCPSITGLTLRMRPDDDGPEMERDAFWDEVRSGVTGIGRPVEIDMHPGGVTDSLPGTGLTARPAPDLIRAWPGRQQLFLWGDPAFAAGYVRQAAIAGAGVEWCEPLTFWGRYESADGDPDPYDEPELRMGRGVWEKYRYTYRLWGRLSYDPDADPETWRRFLRREYGVAAEPVEAALSAASRVLPLLAGTYRPSVGDDDWTRRYLDLPVVAESDLGDGGHDTTEATFGQLGPHDRSLFASIDEFADDVVAGYRSGKYSPIDVADWLEQLAATAEANLVDADAAIESPTEPAFRRLSVDVRCLLGLARFVAGKIRSSLTCALFARTREPAYLEQALATYTVARDAYAAAVEVSSGVYRNPPGFGMPAPERGHGADRLERIDADLAALKQWYARVEAESSARQRPSLEVPRGSRAVLRHTVPTRFQAGADLALSWKTRADKEVDHLLLHYRHLNQGEEYQTVSIQRTEPGVFHATVPGSYTTSPHPISYYVTVFDGHKDAWIEPGFDETLANQPVHLVFPA